MLMGPRSSKPWCIVQPRAHFPTGGRVESGAMQGVDEMGQDETRNETLPFEEVERLVDLVREKGIGEVSVRQGDVEITVRSEEHTSELQSRQYLVCRLLLEKKKK